MGDRTAAPIKRGWSIAEHAKDLPDKFSYFDAAKISEENKNDFINQLTQLRFII